MTQIKSIISSEVEKGMRKLFVFIIMFITSFPAHAQFGGLFGPENYDQCILESMKGVTSDLAAQTIAFSCRQEFPEEEKSRAPLTSEQLRKIERTGGEWRNSGSIVLDVYNANDVCIGSLVYRITIKLQNSGGQERENRVIDLEFKPLSGYRSRPLSVTEFFANAGKITEIDTWSLALISGTRCSE